MSQGCRKGPAGRTARWRLCILLACLGGGATPASAQLLGGRLPLQVAPPLQGVLPQLPLVAQTERLVSRLDPVGLLDQRVDRLDAFVRAHRADVERDPDGEPVVRGRILAIAPSSEAVSAAVTAGFTVVSDERLEAIELDVTVLGPPPHMSAFAALRRLRALDPAGSYDYDHLYFEAGSISAAAESAASAAQDAQPESSVRVGLIDTGVDGRNPALASARIEAKGFAPGAPQPAAHGTATAALIAGQAPGFRGAAPGATVLAADIYGAKGGGDALDLARAMAWMAEARAVVINVSLVGPPNRVLEAAVRSLSAQGRVVVAAVGNDGPAAPPQYPASYPQVVAVSAVDRRGRPLIEAGHATHVDFCAPGADMAAPAGPSGFVTVRGTSFAAPIVAGLLAGEFASPDPAAARAAIDALGRRAVRAGPDCGRGVLGADLRASPQSLRAGPWPGS